LFRFGQVSKSEQAPTPTHARRHPAFAEFCKACTRPSSGRMAGEAYTVAHSRRISSRPMSLHLRGTSFVDFGQLSKLHTPTHARRHFLENSPKVHFGTPHLHARGILCQNSDMILRPDPARASRSSPAPRGQGAVLAIAPERGGGRAPFGDG
jgi:hypothetical protein